MATAAAANEAAAPDHESANGSHVPARAFLVLHQGAAARPGVSDAGRRAARSSRYVAPPRRKRRASGRDDRGTALWHPPPIAWCRTERTLVVFATLTDRTFTYATYPESTTLHPLVRLARWFTARRQAARIESDLESLSDETLADIGVSRSEIHAIAYGQLRQR